MSTRYLVDPRRREVRPSFEVPGHGNRQNTSDTRPDNKSKDVQTCVYLDLSPGRRTVYRRPIRDGVGKRVAQPPKPGLAASLSKYKRSRRRAGKADAYRSFGVPARFHSSYVNCKRPVNWARLPPTFFGPAGLGRQAVQNSPRNIASILSGALVRKFLFPKFLF